MIAKRSAVKSFFDNLKFLHFVVALILACIVLLLITNYVGIHSETANGYKAGVVVEIEQVGFWKTWECKMLISGDAARPEFWCFSVKDPEVQKQLRAAVLSGKRVTVSYREYFLTSFREGITNVLAESVLQP